MLSHFLYIYIYIISIQIDDESVGVMLNNGGLDEPVHCTRNLWQTMISLFAWCLSDFLSITLRLLEFTYALYIFMRLLCLAYLCDLRLLYIYKLCVLISISPPAAVAPRLVMREKIRT